MSRRDYQVVASATLGVLGVCHDHFPVLSKSPQARAVKVRVVAEGAFRIQQGEQLSAGGQMVWLVAGWKGCARNIRPGCSQVGSGGFGFLRFFFSIGLVCSVGSAHVRK